jgi:type IV secretion system protein VirB3
MSYDNEKDYDPLFVGMTRPPIVMGVPMEFFGINFIIFGIGMIAFASLSAKALFVLLICLPLHVFGYIATEKEPHWMSIYLTKLTKCGPIQNRGFWKSNSYKP